MAGFHMQEQSEERKPGITFGIVDGNWLLMESITDL